eukprot:TRINITY_DN2918_c5_g1_i1.p1 TRINITY_DN2918_c5_g1~~TRINITY_DN2918_c5_g1_i1.p1  ORF type:complete len:233 (-),score=53.28 TRINITY_DN2918_c5_g1_i1:80-778(-)
MSVNKKIQDILKNTYQRDKFAKILQYGCKFLGWYQKDVASDEKEAKHLNSISSQISIGRKLFRLGRFAHEYDALFTFFTQNMSKAGIPEWVNTLKLAFLSNYWLFDNLYWLVKVGLYKSGDLERFKKLGMLSWFVSSVFGIVGVYFKYIKNQKSLAIAKSKENNEQVNQLTEERKFIIAGFIKATCDVFVSLSQNIESKTFPSLYKPHNGVIGLVGVTAAISDLYVIWNTKK